MPTATETFNSKKMTDPKERASEDFDTLKDDIVGLRSDIGSFVSSLKGYAGANMKDGVERGKDMAVEAGKRLEVARDDIEGRVRSHPLAAVGIAFGAGLLIAMLNRK